MPRVLPIALLWMLLASAPIPAQAPDRLGGLVQAPRREAPATEAVLGWRLRRALRAPLAGIAIDGDGLTRDDWLDLLMTHRLQPTFGHDQVRVVHDYPASQCALAASTGAARTSKGPAAWRARATSTA